MMQFKMYSTQTDDIAEIAWQFFFDARIAAGKEGMLSNPAQFGCF
jgi:hypothetical protein